MIVVLIGAWNSPVNLFSQRNSLQATGIFLKNYNNYEDRPIPLQKLRNNEALEPTQLIMLFVLWAFGMTLGSLICLMELSVGVRAKGHTGWYLGWYIIITLCKTFRWLQNKSLALAWPGQAKAELLLWSQREVLHNVVCRPVNLTNWRRRNMKVVRKDTRLFNQDWWGQGGFRLCGEYS